MTSKELIKWLESHGYTLKRVVGSHTILSNPTVESIITLPNGKKGPLSPGIIAAVRRNVVEKGVVSEQEFKQSLRVQ